MDLRHRFSGLPVVLFAFFQVFASPCESSAFDFKREIFGPTPTLSVTVEEVRERTGFELLIPDKIAYTKAPTDEELRILRELDPDQRYTKPKEE